MANEMVEGLGIGFGGVKRKVIPLSENPLWAKWKEDTAKLHELETRLRYATPHDETWQAEAQVLIAECRDRLERAHELLSRRLRWIHRWSGGDLIYRLLHHVEEDLVLLMSREEFSATLMSVKDEFERNVHDPLLTRTWLSSGCFSKLVQRYVPESRQGPGADDHAKTAARADRDGDMEELPRHDRELLRGALGILNENVDREFWRLAMNMRIQVANTVVFILLVATWWAVFGRFSVPLVGWVGVAMLGAAGALLSNMLASRQFVLPYAHVSIAFAFYCFVIPMLGAAAAAFIYALGKTELLFKLPGETYSPEWTRVVVAVVAGFFGERVLRGTMESVFQKLFGKATKEKGGEA